MNNGSSFLLREIYNLYNGEQRQGRNTRSFTVSLFNFHSRKEI